MSSSKNSTLLGGSPPTTKNPSPHLYQPDQHQNRKITREQKMLAEQRRREAVKETSIDLLAIENLRAMARMSEDEVNQSKAIITCFLAGDRDGKADAPEDMRGTKFMEDFQNDVSNESCGAYHYFHDPSMPLPQPLPEKATPQLTQQTNDNRSILSRATGTEERVICPDRDHADDSNQMTTAAPQTKRKRDDLNAENDNSSELNQSTRDAGTQGNNSKALQSSIQTAKTPACDDFLKIDKNNWVCNRCLPVHPSFRAVDATFTKKPSDDMKRRHREHCLGEKADLSSLVNSFHALTKSSKVRFHHLSTKEFKAVISSAVGGNEEFVTLFTDDVRKVWMSPKQIANSTTRVKWSEFPSSNVQEEELLAALANFARSGVGFEFVENPHFENFFHLIAPDYTKFNKDYLIKCW